MIIVYTIAYSLVFFIAVVGNTLVILVVYRNSRMHTVTNYFIVNLAVADILVTVFCLPITLVNNLISGWRLGVVMCKVTPFLQGTSVSASVSTLVAIAVDRYIAICHTLELHMTGTVARLIIVLIWLFSMAIMSPWAIYYQIDYHNSPRQTIPTCVEIWSQDPTADKSKQKGYFLGATFLCCYTLPLLSIVICYTLIALRVWRRNAPGVANTSEVIFKSKVKVLKMLSCVVVLFAFSWLPLYATKIRILFGGSFSGMEEKILIQTILPIAQWLGSSNSCINPIVYCFFSRKFRRGFKELTLRCCSSPPDGRIPLSRLSSNTYYHSVHESASKHTYTSLRAINGSLAGRKSPAAVDFSNTAC
ncbi:DgyrCDS12641 [Dimorphilus gyrociliatus]|uniref:DgyrCDS12641 n=1 Tax=Dimorphilus gyrociliatus TaxID=2664684 RepID=A0A7I8W7S7_9ANNE|nr:DgyrCDS12641 [Dimorphilus gyrociliatus]